MESDGIFCQVTGLFAGIWFFGVGRVGTFSLDIQIGRESVRTKHRGFAKCKNISGQNKIVLFEFLTHTRASIQKVDRQPVLIHFYDGLN